MKRGHRPGIWIGAGEGRQFQIQIELELIRYGLQEVIRTIARQGRRQIFVEVPEKYTPSLSRCKFFQVIFAICNEINQLVFAASRSRKRCLASPMR